MNRRARFEAMYRADPDPWAYETSEYEAEKYRHTVAALPREHYGSILEIGCSIGVLSRQLAGRGERFTGIDLSETALQAARARALPGMEFRHMEIPAQWPDGQFDLIVVSEVLYYLDRAEIALTAERCRTSLTAGGDCVAVNWRGPTGTPIDGETAAGLFAAAFLHQEGTRKRRRLTRPDYLLDLYTGASTA